MNIKQLPILGALGAVLALGSFSVSVTQANSPQVVPTQTATALPATYTPTAVPPTSTPMPIPTATDTPAPLPTLTAVLATYTPTAVAPTDTPTPLPTAPLPTATPHPPDPRPATALPQPTWAPTPTATVFFIPLPVTGNSDMQTAPSSLPLGSGLSVLLLGGTGGWLLVRRLHGDGRGRKR